MVGDFAGGGLTGTSRGRAAALLLIAALFGCRREADTGPIVVLWTVDTLGATAADHAGWCDAIGAELAAYGLDGACVEGGVAPSSWSPESHTRLLWPSHAAGDERLRLTPSCESVGLLRVMADHVGGDSIVAIDNPLMSPDGRDGEDCDGEGPWYRDADVAIGAVADIEDAVATAETHQPAWQGLSALLDRTGRGEPAVAFFNEFRAGGHSPRCWYAPDEDACEAMWTHAVDHELVDPASDPASAWLDAQLWPDLGEAIVNGPADGVEAGVQAYWDTIVTSVVTQTEDQTRPRLARLLAELEAQGRLDDLLLVFGSDHGENPCVVLPSGQLNCSHSGTPTPWTGRVPVMIAPASYAEAFADGGFVAADGAPWATRNLAYALTAAVGAEPDDSWPDPEPVGTALSLACGRGTSAVWVADDSAVACDATTCAGYPWGPIDDPNQPWTREPEIAEALTVHAQPVDGYANGAAEACRVSDG